MPIRREPVSRSSIPNRRAIRAVTSGTVAMNSPASELEIRSSAHVSAHQVNVISTMAKANDPAPVPAQEGQLAGEERDRQEDGRTHGEPPEDDHGGGQRLDGDLDEQVRQAPDEPEAHEEDPAAS